MKKHIKRISIVLAVVFIVCALTVLVGHIRIKVMESKLHPVTQPFSSMENVAMCIDRIFPLSDTEKCIGFSDYVFIGTVEEILGTKYDELFYRKFILWEDTPETYYKIKVQHNIKGTAPEEFTMLCYGGRQPNGLLEAYQLMPENDSTYVFMCCENQEYISLFNCRYMGDENWFDSSDNVGSTIELYETYYENQDLSVRI